MIGERVEFGFGASVCHTSTMIFDVPDVDGYETQRIHRNHHSTSLHSLGGLVDYMADQASASMSASEGMEVSSGIVERERSASTMSLNESITDEPALAIIPKLQASETQARSEVAYPGSTVVHLPNPLEPSPSHSTPATVVSQHQSPQPLQSVQATQ